MQLSWSSGSECLIRLHHFKSIGKNLVPSSVMWLLVGFHSLQLVVLRAQFLRSCSLRCESLHWESQYTSIRVRKQERLSTRKSSSKRKLNHVKDIPLLLLDSFDSIPYKQVTRYSPHSREVDYTRVWTSWGWDHWGSSDVAFHNEYWQVLRETGNNLIHLGR